MQSSLKVSTQGNEQNKLDSNGNNSTKKKKKKKKQGEREKIL